MPKQPLNIAFLISSFSGGGIESFILTLGRYFQKQGHRVSVICTLFDGAWFPRLKASGFGVIRLPGLGERSPWHCLLDLQTHLAKARYDVLIPNQDALTMALLPWLKTLTHVPVVLPVAHMDIEYALRVSSWHAAYADALVGVSRRVSEQLKKGLSSLPRGQTLPPIQTIFNALPPVAENAPELSPHPGNLLYVGRFHHAQKGVLYLPDILAAVYQRLLSLNPVLASQLRFTLIGDGPDREEMLQAFERRGLSDRMNWLGTQPPARVQHEMQRAWGLLFPSAFEGLPFVLLEAQQAGLPAVAFNLPGITEDCLIEGETGWIVPQRDQESFVEKTVALLLMNASQRLERGVLARQHAEQFSLERIGSQYLELITRCSPLPTGESGLKRRERGLPTAKDLFHYLFSHPDPETAQQSQAWALQLEQGKPMTQRLIAQGIRRVAIYGTARLGRLLAWDCKLSGLEVVCFLDQNPALHGQACIGKPILTPSEAIKQNLFSGLDAILFSIEGTHSVRVQSEFIQWAAKHLKATLPPCVCWKNLALFKSSPWDEPCRLLTASVS